MEMCISKYTEVELHTLSTELLGGLYEKSVSVAIIKPKEDSLYYLKTEMLGFLQNYNKGTAINSKPIKDDYLAEVVVCFEVVACSDAIGLYLDGFVEYASSLARSSLVLGFEVLDYEDMNGLIKKVSGICRRDFNKYTLRKSSSGFVIKLPLGF